MNVIKITPRGYCHGVLNALNLVKTVIKDASYPRPIFILGMIIHNKKITHALSELGVITLDHSKKTRLELLDEINDGTVIFTAHGVSDAVVAKAEKKGLTIVNASCKDVVKIHDLIKEKLAEGFFIGYIGKAKHPETEGVLGMDASIYLIETPSDVHSLNTTKPLFLTNQTTLSQRDIKDTVEACLEKYPDLVFSNDICHATSIRQNAVANQKGADLCIVVGDALSSNTQKLMQVSKKEVNIPTYTIEGIEDIQLVWLKNKHTVSVTAGASTPTAVTREVIHFLEQFVFDDVSTHNQKSRLKPIDLL